jgi:hypothetical protein
VGLCGLESDRGTRAPPAPSLDLSNYVNMILFAMCGLSIINIVIA